MAGPRARALGRRAHLRQSAKPAPRWRIRFERAAELHLAFMLLGCAVVPAPPQRRLGRVVVGLSRPHWSGSQPEPHKFTGSRGTSPNSARVELVLEHLAAMAPVI